MHWSGVYHEPVDVCEKRFADCLDKIGNDFVEIAMVSIVDTEKVWNGWAQKSLERMADYKRKGQIGYLGLSGHNAEVAIKAAESGLINVLLFPFNMYQYPRDEMNRELLEICEKLVEGVMAMKAYYGGKLINTYGKPTDITPAECLNYVLSLPVSTVVPGVQNAEHMREAIESQELSSRYELPAVVGEELSKRLKGQCVQCKHCLPCPQDIRIHSVILAADYLDFYSGTDFSRDFNRKNYGNMKVKASVCTECGICMDRCLFDVDIIGKMQRAVELFETVA